MENEVPRLPVAGAGPSSIIVPPGVPLLDCTVHGTPVQQGSKTRMRWSVIDDNAERLTPWRTEVTETALREKILPTPWDGPVGMTVTYWFVRPRSHYRTGRFADQLKPTAPKYHARFPDLDKLLRATMDALTNARVWVDDNRVSVTFPVKRWAAPNDPPGADITVWGIEE